MLSTVIACVFLSWASGSPIFPDEGPGDLDLYIKNGSRALIPSQAALTTTRSYGTSRCGGSLISVRHVLTAGHCADDAQSILVELGLFFMLSSLQINVGKKGIFVHPRFKRVAGLAENDLAIIKLPSIVLREDFVRVQFIRLPDPFEDYVSKLDGTSAMVAGRGDSDFGVLLKGSVTIMNASVCALYGRELQLPYSMDNLICTTAIESGVCPGDSGGPLIIKEQDGISTLLGVVSFGSDRECKNDDINVFTNVQRYLSWIRETTGLRLPRV